MIGPTDVLYKNANYTVYISTVGREFNGQHYSHCYAVVNTNTRVAESYERTLPAAIHYAESLNLALVNKAWEWMTKQMEDEVPASSH